MFKREEEDFTRTTGGNFKKTRCMLSVRVHLQYLGSSKMLQFTNKDITSLDKEVAEW